MPRIKFSFSLWKFLFLYQDNHQFLPVLLCNLYAVYNRPSCPLGTQNHPHERTCSESSHDTAWRSSQPSHRNVHSSYISENLNWKAIRIFYTIFFKTRYHPSLTRVHILQPEVQCEIVAGTCKVSLFIGWMVPNVLGASYFKIWRIS